MGDLMGRLVNMITKKRKRIKELEAESAMRLQRMEWSIDELVKFQIKASDLFMAIRNGSEEHQTWLEKAIRDHFAGHPVEAPRG